MSSSPSSPDRPRPGALAELLDRMAHQLKNPLQAVTVNLEVLRARVRKEVPELWEELERFAAAVDQNAALLNERLELLLALARARPEDEPGAVDLTALCRELVEALRFDQEAPEVTVRGPDVPARARRGRLVELLYLLLREGRGAAAASGAGGGLEVRVEAEGDRASLEVRGVPGGSAGDGGPGTGESWDELARRAGGELARGPAGGPFWLRLTLPSA